MASTFNPVGPHTLELMILLNTHEFNNRPMFAMTGHYNLSTGERRTITELQQMDLIVFKSADKGRAVIVQSREQYLIEGYRILADPKVYSKLDADLTEKHRLETDSFLFSMLQNG